MTHTEVRLPENHRSAALAREFTRRTLTGVGPLELAGRGAGGVRAGEQRAAARARPAGAAPARRSPTASASRSPTTARSRRRSAGPVPAGLACSSSSGCRRRGVCRGGAAGRSCGVSFPRPRARCRREPVRAMRAVRVGHSDAMPDAAPPPLGADFRLLVQDVRRLRDLHARPRRGTSSRWNAGAERIKGYRADEIIGKHFSVFYPTRTTPPTSPPTSSRPPSPRAASRTRAGASARTAPASGPTSSSPPSTTTTASSAASARSPAT